MEILHTFGVDPMLLVAQIINFIVVLWILKKFLYKPILDTLEKRKQTIKEGMTQAEEARIILEKTQKGEKEILKKAQESSKKILAETKMEAEKMLMDAKAQAKEQAEKMLEESKKQIEYEMRIAEKKLSMHISKLAIEMLRKSASQVFKGEAQAKLVMSMVEKLKKRVD